MEEVLKEAFGESSESEIDQQEEDDRAELKDLRSKCEDGLWLVCGESPTWEPIKHINGLWLCRDFLSSDQQSSLLTAIDEEGWFTKASHNQAMRFGDLPSWAIELSNSIREVVHFSDGIPEATNRSTFDDDKEACIFPSDLLWREPLFNQLIVNVYQPGEGICAHVDLMRFDDGIAIVSLESSCVMYFSPVKSEGFSVGEAQEGVQLMTKVPVLLTPGSLVLMWGEARYIWRHEINRRPGFQKWEGQNIDQKRRTSITLRKLRQTELGY